MHETPDVELLGPPPFKWGTSLVIWLTAIFVLASIWFGVGPARMGTPVNSWLDLWSAGAVVIAIAVAAQVAQFMGRDIVVSVEGVRKGKGPRSTFVAWLGASIRYDRKNHRYFITSKHGHIRFSYANFSNHSRFEEVMRHVRNTIAEQNVRQNAHLAKIDTPIYGLSDKEGIAFRDSGMPRLFEKFLWPYLLVPILGACVAYLAFLFSGYLPKPLGSVVRQAVHTHPDFFRQYVPMVVFLILFVVAARGHGYLEECRNIRRCRSAWFQQFDRGQIISISEIGIQFRYSKDQGRQRIAEVCSWNDVTWISISNGLILFHIEPEFGVAVIVPRRIFPSAKAAREFLRNALAFKRAALTQPNVVEPISFWEIA